MRRDSRLGFSEGGEIELLMKNNDEIRDSRWVLINLSFELLVESLSPWVSATS